MSRWLMCPFPFIWLEILSLFLNQNCWTCISFFFLFFCFFLSPKPWTTLKFDAEFFGPLLWWSTLNFCTRGHDFRFERVPNRILWMLRTWIYKKTEMQIAPIIFRSRVLIKFLFKWFMALYTLSLFLSLSTFSSFSN